MAGPEPRRRPLRVALVSSAGESGGLRRLLEAEGLRVVLEVAPDRLPCERIEDWHGADVILLDLDDGDEASLACLAQLADGPPLPLVFVDSETARASGGARLGRKLAGKLLAEAGLGEAEAPAPRPPRRQLRVVGRAAAEAAPVPTTLPAPPADGPVEVWGLGASIGGPQALKRFLSRLPEEVPFAFVLAQHIGENFMDLLAQQLARETALEVRIAGEGDTLAAGRVLLVPVGRAIGFDGEGRIRLRRLEGTLYDPSIDRTLEAVAERWGPRAGAILFSGMGDDGLAGCHELVRRGGTVWAQEPKSCVVSSMADQARERGYVTYSGTPEQLAERMVRHARAHARLARAGARGG